MSDVDVARRIRQSVDASGGSRRATVRDLRDAFGRARLTDRARSEIETALGREGLVVHPALAAVRLDDPVTLQLASTARPLPPAAARPGSGAAPPPPGGSGALPPPGWLADPWNERLLRYWDGRSWTGWTEPRRTPAAPPRPSGSGVRTPPPAPSPVETAWRRYRRWPVWLQWAAPLLVFVILVGALGDSQPASDDDQAQTLEPAPTDAEPAPPADDRAAARVRERRRARRERRERRDRRERRERRERRAAQPPATSEPDEPDPPPDEPEPAGDCHESYDPCVPAPPPDLNCPDVDGPVTVTGDDPHGLDRDDDGVGCE